jgi:glucose-6-phosphate 1-dehydrogenase
MNNNLPVSIVIFGASGDLTQRKLVPSLFNLYRKERMPKKFHIAGYGGTAFTDEQFRTHLKDGMKEFASFKYTDEEWNNFASTLVYQQGRYDSQTENGSLPLEIVFITWQPRLVFSPTSSTCLRRQINSPKTEVGGV